MRCNFCTGDRSCLDSSASWRCRLQSRDALQVRPTAIAIRLMAPAITHQAPASAWVTEAAAPAVQWEWASVSGCKRDTTSMVVVGPTTSNFASSSGDKDSSGALRGSIVDDRSYRRRRRRLSSIDGTRREKHSRMPGVDDVVLARFSTELSTVSVDKVSGTRYVTADDPAAVISPWRR